MASLDNGYRVGGSGRSLRTIPVAAASSDITAGDFLTLSSGYAAKATGSDSVYAVAVSSVASPSANGDVFVLADVSEETQYYVTVGTGTITQAMQSETCDIDSATTIDVTASDEDTILIVEPDVDNNAAWIQIRPTYAGVV